MINWTFHSSKAADYFGVIYHWDTPLSYPRIIFWTMLWYPSLQFINYGLWHWGLHIPNHPIMDALSGISHWLLPGGSTDTWWAEYSPHSGTHQGGLPLGRASPPVSAWPVARTTLTSRTPSARWSLHSVRCASPMSWRTGAQLEVDQGTNQWLRSHVNDG